LRVTKQAKEFQMQKRIWSEYNRKLVQRGSVTFMIHEKTVRQIQNFKPKSKNGRPQKYPDALIELLVVVKIRFNLGYRSLEGFAKSIFQELKRWFEIPDYSTICKRAKALSPELKVALSKQPRIISLDATGIKVYGEGEWKRKIHGVGRPRKWLKLHVGLDEETQLVVADSLTESNTSDCSMVDELLDQIDSEIVEVKADGAYDGQPSRSSIKKKGAKPIIPPPRNARVKCEKSERDDAVLEILGLGNDEQARSLWGKLTGYSRRVLVETFFSRYKRLFGGRLFSKLFETQVVENLLKIKILNAMTMA